MSRRLRDRLREDQRFVVGVVRREAAKLIVLPMGRGKTGSLLTAVRDLLDRFEIRRVLVIAPLRVARDTWPEEIETWQHTACMSYSLVIGDEKERLAAVARDAEITIINREILPWLARQIGVPSKWPYDCVIVDESSMFKAGKQRTTRTKVKRADGSIGVRKGGKVTRFGVLAKVRKYVSRIYLLTGTPAPNGLQDLWGQIYLLDQGKRLGLTQKQFLDRWFDINQYSRKITARSYAHDEIMGRIGDVMLSLPPMQIVDDPVYIPVYVDLPPAVMREYRDFERELVSEPHDVEAVTRGVLTNKLLQFANGSMYREDKTVAEVHKAKLDALDELIEDAAGEPVMVLYGFKFDLDAIRARHPEAVVLNECETAVKDWNDGKIKILLAHPASCAHGLNMQYGGHIAIWYGLTWSLELYQQANARLPRPGQTHLVRIYQIIARGTADEKVLETLAGKAETQDDVTAAVMQHLGINL